MYLARDGLAAMVPADLVTPASTHSHDGPKGGEIGSQSGDSTESKRPLGQSI